MRRVLILLVPLALLSACGGPSASVAPTAAPTTVPPSVPPTSAPTTVPTAAPPTIAPINTPTAAPTAPQTTAAPTSAPTAASAPAATALGTAPVTGTLTEAAPYYTLDLPPGGVVSGTLAVDAAASAPIKLVLLDKDQKFVVDQLVEPGQRGALVRIFPSSYSGTVYLTLQSNGRGQFTLQAQVVGQNDAGGGKDAGDTIGQALPIQPGDHQGLLGDDDQSDFYSLDLPKGSGTLTVTVLSDGVQDHTVKLALFNEAQTFVTDVTAPFTTRDPVPLVWALPPEQSGRWYLLVSGKGSYRLTVHLGGS